MESRDWGVSWGGDRGGGYWCGRWGGAEAVSGPKRELRRGLAMVIKTSGLVKDERRGRGEEERDSDSVANLKRGAMKEREGEIDQDSQ